MIQEGNNKSRLVFSVFVSGIIFLGLFCLPVNKAFAVSNTTGYAWSDRIGWINFGCANCNVMTTSTGTTGYAWSQNYGWIKLNPVNSGVVNDGSGVLSGNAWGEKLGWINFSGTTIVSSGSSEYYRNTATGNIVGTINFSCTNCNVNTTWVPSVSCGDGSCNGTETSCTCPQDCPGICGGGGPASGHSECDYVAQQCKSLSTGTASDSTCTIGDNSKCMLCSPHGDINKNGKMGIRDFSMLLTNWGQIFDWSKNPPLPAPDYPPPYHLSPPYTEPPYNKCADISHANLAATDLKYAATGTVDITDFSIMLHWWTGDEQ